MAVGGCGICNGRTSSVGVCWEVDVLVSLPSWSEQWMRLMAMSKVWPASPSGLTISIIYGRYRLPAELWGRGVDVGEFEWWCKVGQFVVLPRGGSEMPSVGDVGRIK